MSFRLVFPKSDRFGIRVNTQEPSFSLIFPPWCSRMNVYKLVKKIFKRTSWHGVGISFHLDAMQGYFKWLLSKNTKKIGYKLTLCSIYSFSTPTGPYLDTTIRHEVKGQGPFSFPQGQIHQIGLPAYVPD